MTHRRMARVIFLCLLGAAVPASRAAAETRNQAPAPSAGTGILLMAHGGSKAWNDQVRGVAAETDKQMPTEVALGMADRSTLQAAIDKLTTRGVTAIVAVPLFVSSHSSVIESTKYLLGLRADAPPELADFAAMGDMDMSHGAHDLPMSGGAASAPSASTPPALPRPVTSRVPIRMASALDHHPIVADILADRAAAISDNPAREVVILVAHGPNDDAENAEWLADMTALSQRIEARAPYARIECVTLRDDADATVRNRATTDLRARVQAADKAGSRVLIVPLLLSYGGIEDGLRQRLDGLDHTFSPNALLPDARLASWVLATARETSGQ